MNIHANAIWFDRPNATVLDDLVAALFADRPSADLFTGEYDELSAQTGSHENNSRRRESEHFRTNCTGRLAENPLVALTNATLSQPYGGSMSKSARSASKAPRNSVKTPITKKAVARVQEAIARQHDAGVPKGSYVGDLQRALAKTTP